MTKKPTAIFFDWDGTLVDSLPFLLKAHNHVRASMNLAPWSVLEYKQHMRHSSRELYGPLYRDKADQALQALKDFIQVNHLHNIKVLPDVLTLLESLEAQDLPSGVVSNKMHEFLQREISHLQWNKYFPIAIGAGYVSKDKPDPEPLLTALSESGLTPGPDIWYVGDSEADMCTAQAAGCSAVLIRHHHDNDFLMEMFNPAHVFDNCADLRDFLQAA